MLIPIIWILFSHSLSKTITRISGFIYHQLWANLYNSSVTLSPPVAQGDEISKMLPFLFTFFQPCFLWFLHYITELGACYKKAKTLSCSYEKTLECDFSWCRNWSYYAINWVNIVPHKLVWKWNCPPREFYMKINLKSIKSQHAAP